MVQGILFAVIMVSECCCIRREVCNVGALPPVDLRGIPAIFNHTRIGERWSEKVERFRCMITLLYGKEIGSSPREASGWG